MSIQAKLAAFGGDIWASKRSFAFWPWPAVVFGMWHWYSTEDDYRCFTKWLKPGDILLTKSQPYPFSNFFISGTAYKHLAVYTGAVHGIKDREHGFISSPKPLGISRMHTGKARQGEFERTITHAISEGIVCQDLLRLTNHVDYIMAVRPWVSELQQTAIVNTALGQVGMGYNFDFTPEGPKEFYCTELGAYCLTAAEIELPKPIEKKVSLLGKKGPVYLADSFVAKYPPVCCSVSSLQPEFFRSSPYGDIIRQRVMAAENAGV